MISLYGGSITATVAPLVIDQYQFVNVYGTQFYNYGADADGLPYRGAILYGAQMGNISPLVEGSAGNISGSVGSQLVGGSSSKAQDLNIGGTLAGLATGISASANTQDNNADITIADIVGVTTPISDSGVNNGFVFNKGQGWTSYTPTLSCNSGSLTTASATGRYKRLGKTVYVTMVITVTTNGTCATNLLASLPVAGAGAGVFNGAGTAGTNNGFFGIEAGPGYGSLVLFAYNGTYGFGSGYVVYVSGTCEVP